MSAEIKAVEKHRKLLENVEFIYRSDTASVSQREISFQHAGICYSILQQYYSASTDPDTEFDTISTFYYKGANFHRINGPAIEQNLGNPHKNPACNFGWALNGNVYSENEFNFWLGIKA